MDSGFVASVAVAVCCCRSLLPRVACPDPSPIRSDNPASAFHFDAAIPARTDGLKELVVPDVKTDEKVNHLCCEGQSHLATMSLFYERGVYSKTLYQTDCNHRPLQYTSLTEENEKQKTPALMDSFVVDATAKTSTMAIDEGTLSQSIDLRDPIAFNFYRVRNKDSPPPPGDAEDRNDRKQYLYSPSTLKVPCVRDETGAQGDSPVRAPTEDSAPEDVELRAVGGNLPDRYPAMLDNEAFQRTLELFGYEYQFQQDETVTLKHLMAFAMLFRDYKMKTRADVDAFLADFRLRGIIDFGPETDACDAVYEIGLVVRSLSPMRIGVHEGRHRMYIITTYLTGHYLPTDEIPLRRISFADAYKDRDPYKARSPVDPKVSLTCQKRGTIFRHPNSLSPVHLRSNTDAV